MSVKIPRTTIFFLLLLSAVSCYYPKVSVTKEEKKAIVYKHKTKVVFSNNRGDIDTVLVYRESGSNYEPTFDFWLDKKEYYGNSTTNTMRSFGKEFVTYPNWESNKSKTSYINLSERIYYSISEFDEGPVLQLEGFNESYVIKKDKKDSLVFKDRTNKNVNFCSTNPHCVVRIVYTTKNGIVLVEKGTGEIWKYVKKIKK